MIPIGGTCGGWFDSDEATAIDEIRKITTTRHEPIYTQILNKNLALKNQLIINFDSYNDGDRGWKSEAILRELIRDTIFETNVVGARYGLSINNIKQLTTVTGDNEADEIYSIPEYCYWMRILIDEVKGRFDIGLGNFNGAKPDAYEYICANVSGFKYMDIHLQRDFETYTKVNNNLLILKKIANKYGKILRVTEAFPVDSNLWTQDGYNLLLHQLSKSAEYDAKAFCCFIRFDRDGKYKNLPFLRGNEVHPNWKEFKNIIQTNKPKIILEEEGLMLEKYYYRLKETFNRDPRETGVRFIQTCLNLKADADWQDKTQAAVLKYQELNGLEQDAIVGPITFRNMMKDFPFAYIDLQYFVATGVW